MVRLCAVGLAVVIVGCGPTRPSASPGVRPSAQTISSPTPAATSAAVATPDGTISIRCFLTIHALIDAYRHLESQLDAFPVSDQLDLLAEFGAHIRELVTHAPAGCFSDEENAAYRELFLYLLNATAYTITAERIQELMTATGLPHPTAHP